MHKLILAAVAAIGFSAAFADVGPAHGDNTSVGQHAQKLTCPELPGNISAGAGATGGPGAGTYEIGPDGCPRFAANYWDNTRPNMCYAQDRAGVTFRGLTQKKALAACGKMSHAKGCHIIGCE